MKVLSRLGAYQKETQIYIALFFSYLAYIVLRLSTGDLTDFAHQHDFQVYYKAGANFLNGENPYSIDYRNQFLYPPFTLYVFSLFSKFSYTAAYFLFLGVKFLWFAVFVAIIFRQIEKYHKHVSRDVILTVVIFVLALGFGRAIQKDFTVDNTTIFEAVLVWLAIAGLLDGRHLRFALLVLAVSTLKLYSIALVFLLVFIDDKRKAAGYILLSLAVFAVYTYANIAFFDEEWVKRLLENHQALSTRAASSGVNFAVLGFFFDLNHLDLAAFNPYYAYAAVFVAISLSSLYVLFIDNRPSLSLQDSVFFSVVVLYLILPRYQDYSMVVLLPIAITLALKLDRRSRLIYLVLTLVPLKPLFGWVDEPFKIVYWYQNYVSLIATYFFYIAYFYKASRQPGNETGSLGDNVQRNRVA